MQALGSGILFNCSKASWNIKSLIIFVKNIASILSILSKTDAQALSGSKRFSFYLNVYNAFTIKLVLTKFPGINSIKEVEGFFSNSWSKKFILIQGRRVSLDYIEHDILRPEFKDARVHFAINCASKSCPPPWRKM